MSRLQIIKNDPYLLPYESDIERRTRRFYNELDSINSKSSLYKYSNWHQVCGFHRHKNKNGWWFREFAPNADKIYILIFHTNKYENLELRPIKNGHWEIFIEDNYFKGLPIESFKFKILVVSSNIQQERIPAFIRRVTQESDYSFTGRITKEDEYKWKVKKIKRNIKEPLLIYECHIGMAQEEEKVGTYNEFKVHILPRVKRLGYNAIQLMAVMEHPYYGSFGYHVSSFFAPSSRFGNGNELKGLIDEAHSLGITVIMDLVHSHAVKNEIEGLTRFDVGSELYFREGQLGWHPDWDSRLFAYEKEHVRRFLLSNIRYWLEEYRFDGFRFDGITSMLYFHHGRMSFQSYQDYFSSDTDESAILYLQLATSLAKHINPDVILIAEDMSGMPGLCIPINEGGIGFTHRLGMGIPDYWGTLLEKRDEDWHMGDLFFNLQNRRIGEPTISYVESHDQALVGEKTVAFRLMDKEMYTSMSVFTQNYIVDRGIALHKLMRFITLLLGGESYLNFMGNEFGHPEWIDFPRAENNWSHYFARRQWSLADNNILKYKFLETFDIEMIKFIKQEKILSTKAQIVNEDNKNQILVFTKGKFLCVFSFSQVSFKRYDLSFQKKFKFKLVFHSDQKNTGGFNRLTNNEEFNVRKIRKELKFILTIPIPSRTCIILKKMN